MSDAKSVFDVMWAAEKRNVSETAELLEKVDEYLKFIVDISNTTSDHDFPKLARSWLIVHGCAGDISPSLRAKDGAASSN